MEKMKRFDEDNVIKNSKGKRPSDLNLLRSNLICVRGR